MNNNGPAALHEALVAMTTALQDLYRTEALPGLSALIIHRQTLLWHGHYGYADLVTKQAPNLQTIYGVGSITKIFTAIMLLQLQEAGKLQVDEPVARYLPELNRLPTATPVTFRQLASHTAGLPMMPPLPELAQVMQEFPPRIETLQQMRFPTSARLLELLPMVAPIAPPGTQMAYSNLGVALLAQALERVAGQAYTDYIQEYILQPLGMTHSGFTPPDIIIRPSGNLLSALYYAACCRTTGDESAQRIYSCGWVKCIS